MEYITTSLLSTDKKPEIILNGTKILTLSFSGVRLIDSFSFLPFALEKFPKKKFFQNFQKIELLSPVKVPRVIFEPSYFGYPLL